jgi:hypothetical protein
MYCELGERGAVSEGKAYALIPNIMRSADAKSSEIEPPEALIMVERNMSEGLLEKPTKKFSFRNIL